LVARIRGSGDGPSLLLLSHTDVVLADASEWSVPPFSGEVRDGEIWGRGALDMKGQVAAAAVAIASLAREGFAPAGDLVFAATAALVAPLLAPTFSPTVISASQKRNVIPALCEIIVDCRLLPGQEPAAVEPAIREALGNDSDYDLDWVQVHGGTRSPLDTPLWRAVDDFVAESEPGARAVPTCCAGFTDSHWLREAFGTVA